MVTSGERIIEGRFERTLAASGPVRLEVTVDSGAVQIRGGSEDGAVHVRGVLRARRPFLGWGDAEERVRRLEANPPVAQTQNGVRVGLADDSWGTRGITLLIEIVTPRETEVRAHTDSGDIRVEGVRGAVWCDADSGRIEIAAIEGDVRASADSGSIRIRQVSGAVYAEADSGSIEAVEIAGTIEASADSGEIRLTQTLAAPVRGRADSGAIGITLADEAGYNLRAQSDSGRITTPELTYARERSPNSVEGQVRGGGPLVELRTDSGRIDVAQARGATTN